MFAYRIFLTIHLPRYKWCFLQIVTPRLILVFGDFCKEHNNSTVSSTKQLHELSFEIFLKLVEEDYMTLRSGKLSTDVTRILRPVPTKQLWKL